MKRLEYYNEDMVGRIVTMLSEESQEAKHIAESEKNQFNFDSYNYYIGKATGIDKALGIVEGIYQSYK